MSSRKGQTREQILIATWQLMEERRGLEVKMADISKVVGISRQALYLHFKNKTELLIATMMYVDEIKGLNSNLDEVLKEESGTALLCGVVEVWGNHIPEIYGMAKSILISKAEDEASANAWNAVMSCLYEACDLVIQNIQSKNCLTKSLTYSAAIDMMMALISIQQWELLVVDYNWSQDQYISTMKRALENILLK